MFALYLLLIIGGFFLLTAVVLVFAGIATVPTAHYGVVTMFGNRTGRILEEGIHMVLPFIQEVALVPFSLRTMDISVQVTSKDGWKISIKGSAKWRAEGKDKVSKILEISEEAITSGLADAIKNFLGQVAGCHNAEDFINYRREIHDIICCILLLEEAPHLNPIDALRIDTTKPDQDKRIKKFVDKTGEVKPTKVIGFYREYRDKIHEMIEAHKVEESHSGIEKLYAIIIKTFDLAEVNYSPESAEALEEAKQAQRRILAQTKLKDAKKTYMEELVGAGLSSDQAHDSSDVLLGLAENRKIINIQGSGRPIVVLTENNERKGK